MDLSYEDKFQITLRNSKTGDELPLVYRVLLHRPAATWKWLTMQTMARSGFRIDHSVLNFSATHEQGRICVERLNWAIRNINEVYDRKIPLLAFELLNNDVLIDLHARFEEWGLRRFQEPRWDQDDCRLPFVLLNSYIHMAEGYLGNCEAINSGETDRIKLWFNYQLLPDFIKPLEDWESNYFTPEYEFGDLLMGFHRLGKNLGHVFWDNDLGVLERKALAPQQMANTEVFAYFCIRRENFWQPFHQWRKNHQIDQKYGINCDDRAHRIGQIPIARLEREMNHHQKVAFIHNLANYDTISSLKFV